MPIDDNVNQQNLQDFINELEKIRFDIRKNAVLNKSSDKYVRNLEKLIKTSKSIVSGTGSKRDDKKFEKLVRDTDMSLRMLRKKNRGDEQFQQEFTNVFGDIKESQDASVSVFKKINVSLKQMTSSISIMSDASAKDVEETGLSFLTGAFGQIAKETVGVDKLSDIPSIAKGKFSGLFGKDIEGQAHDGMNNVPNEGTYMLDGGERVVSPEQNRDLSSFLSNPEAGGGVSSTFLKNIEENTEILSNDKPLEVFNKDHNPTYFDAIIDNDDRLNIERENLENKHHKEIRTKFEILGDIMSAVAGSWLANFVLGISIWSKRFARHPILMTMGILVQGIGGLVKGFAGFTGLSSLLGGIGKFLFGTEAKKDTDRIVQANEDIIDAVRGEAQKDRRGILKKGKEALLGGAVNLGKAALGGIGGMLSKGFAAANKKLPQKRDVKGRFAKRDKTDILIDSIKEVSKGIWAIFEVNDEALEESKKAGKGNGGGLLAGLMGGKGILGKILTGGKSFARFGGTLIKSIGIGLLVGLKTFGLKIFSVLGTKMFGMLGLALTGGGLIGTYLLNPLLNWFDDTFGTGIINMIGGLMVKIIAGLESLPLIGGLIKKITGGESTAAIKSEANIAHTNATNKRNDAITQLNSTAVDKTTITTQTVEKKISEAATYMKQQAQAVSNTVVNNTQQIVKSLPAVDDLGTALASYGG